MAAVIWGFSWVSGTEATCPRGGRRQGRVAVAPVYLYHDAPTRGEGVFPVSPGPPPWVGHFTAARTIARMPALIASGSSSGQVVAELGLGDVAAIQTA